MLSTEDLTKEGQKALCFAEKYFGESVLRTKGIEFKFIFWSKNFPETNGNSKEGYTVRIQEINGNPEFRGDFYLELGHEVIHLLSPNLKGLLYKNVSVFEEGLAVWFSLEYVKEMTSVEHSLQQMLSLKDNKDEKYKRYYKAYTELIKIGEDNIKGLVKSLRKDYPEIPISEWKTEWLETYIEKELAENLTKKFSELVIS